MDILGLLSVLVFTGHLRAEYYYARALISSVHINRFHYMYSRKFMRAINVAVFADFTPPSKIL